MQLPRFSLWFLLDSPVVFLIQCSASYSPTTVSTSWHPNHPPSPPPVPSHTRLLPRAAIFRWQLLWRWGFAFYRCSISVSSRLLRWSRSYYRHFFLLPLWFILLLLILLVFHSAAKRVCTKYSLLINKNIQTVTVRYKDPEFLKRSAINKNHLTSPIMSWWKRGGK